VLRPGLPDGVQRCGACLTDPPLFERCICSVDYAFPWDRLITRFKFKHAPELATVLVEGLVEAARSTHAPHPQAFVPVPLSNERLAERGYDQAWELARRLGRALKRARAGPALQRRFDARHQVQLSRRERLANLQGAFAVPPATACACAGSHMALVDDVMTTGATAHEAARPCCGRRCTGRPVGGGAHAAPGDTTDHRPPCSHRPRRSPRSRPTPAT
jgi:ComF family protein